jgi:hypothetical protein
MALLAPAAVIAPAYAEETPAPEPAADPYDDLYTTMDSVLGTDQEFERHFRIMVQNMRQSPRFQAIERKDPGIVNAIGAAMRPWLKLQTERSEQRTKPRVMALMNEELTPDDARKLAAYCRTERGRKFLIALDRPEPELPRAPLGEPTAFLKPAAGYTPPPPKPVPPPAAENQPQDPAITAILSDPELQARVTKFFTRTTAMYAEMATMEFDKDIADGMFRDVDYAASTFGWRLYDRPL